MIPCFISISSDNEEAVRLLASPQAPIVRLVRRIRHKETRANSAELLVLLGYSGLEDVGTHSKLPALTGELTLVSHEVGRAHWWLPAKSAGQSPNVRNLEGEIHLSSSLPPSCDFQFFQVEVSSILSSGNMTLLISHISFDSTLSNCCLSKRTTLNLRFILPRLKFYENQIMFSPRIQSRSRHSTDRTSQFRLCIVNLQRKISCDG